MNHTEKQALPYLNFRAKLFCHIEVMFRELHLDKIKINIGLYNIVMLYYGLYNTVARKKHLKDLMVENDTPHSSLYTEFISVSTQLYLMSLQI